MKYVVGLAAVAFAATCFGLAETARAGTLQIEEDSFATSYGGSLTGVPGAGGIGGGEFKIYNFSGGSVPGMGAGVAVGNLGTDFKGQNLSHTSAVGTTFQTFCLERNEGVDANGTLVNWTIDDAAVKGGFAGQDTVRGGLPADTLDVRTAYLYQQFWNATLVGYQYTIGAPRIQSAAALQLAIWKIEQELVPTGGSNATDLTALYNGNALAQAFFLDASLHAGPTIGAVRVLNMTVLDGAGNVIQRQSMLIVIPLPRAAWLGLGMIGAFGAFTLIRRRRRQALI